MATDETYSSLESPAFYSPSSSTLSRPPTSNTAGKSDTSMTLKRPYYAAMDEIGSPDEELMNSSSGMMMEDQEGNMGECIQLQLAAGQARGDQQYQKRARRLTVEQVRALERAFDVENKLEPDRKAQLASQLGLQERQVAVWFQNRRARCKTKQMEKDFQALKKKMELLKADRDKLISEKEQLEAEVQRLKREMKEKERQELVKQEDQVMGSAAMVINVKVKPQSPASSSMPQDELVQQQHQQQQSPVETKRSSPSSAASEINTNCKRSSNHDMAYNNNSVRECDDASMNNVGSINTSNLPQESNSADGSALDHVDSSSSTLDQLLISRISPPLNQVNHAINHPNHNLQDHPYGNNLHGHNLDQNYGFLDVYDAYGCISAVHLKGLDFLPKEEGFVPMADWWEAS